MILEILLAVALAYQVFALVAALLFRGQRPEAGGQSTPVSILKSVKGVEPSMRRAIASHTKLAGDYEFLCGVRPGDPARELIAEYPTVRMVETMPTAANGKVGVLMELAKAARYPILIVNDADIRVEPDYIARVTAPLADPKVGMVTCLYRCEGATFAARMEGLGIATDFAPSTLVARALGVKEFAMGSTMAFRRADLDRIGGFASFADYLADDFQLGRRIHALGLDCVLSDVVVTTHMGGNWRDVWHHQVRWARTIRVSKLWGYLGLPVTFAALWALMAAATGHYGWAAGLLAARMGMASAAGFALRSADVFRLWPLIPVRDLFGALVWLVGLFGNTVLWRGLRLRLDEDGRIQTGGAVVERESRIDLTQGVG